MTKPALYRYKLRTLGNPPEFAEFEAGPFTPYAAAVFGQNEAANKALHTGKAWVCDYAAIVEATDPKPPQRLPGPTPAPNVLLPTLFPPWVRSIAMWLLAGLVGGLIWQFWIRR